MNREITTEDGLPTRVIKTSIKHLVMDNNHKQILINAFDKLVLLNSKIVVRGSIIMNYQVAKFVTEGINLTPINQGLLYQAFNWNHRNALSEILPEIKNRIPDPIGNHDENMDKKSWLIDYLVIQYMAHIKSSIQGKYKSVIKQSIKGYIKAHHPDASKNDASSLTTDLTRCIHCPSCDTTMEYSKLDDNA